jgi:RimJ/RimL family protein N-acetyltransferase
MRVSIRIATEADAHGIATVHVLSWQAAYRGIFTDEKLASLSIEEREVAWKRRLIGEDQDCADWTNIVGEADGKIIGFATYRPCGDEDKDRASVGELVAIYVLADHWGQGVGTSMLDEVVSHFEREAVSQVTLWVIEGNHRAGRFYQAAGFKPDGVKKTEVKLGTSVVLVRYIREVSSLNQV